MSASRAINAMLRWLKGNSVLSSIIDFKSLRFFILLSLQVSVGIAAPVPEIALTDSERLWLNEHPGVSFTGDPNWLPYEAFDAKGEYIGIVAEHLKLISKFSGITFDMSPSATWTESTAKARSGMVDILSETDDSDLKSHLVFTNSYLSNPIVIVIFYARHLWASNSAKLLFRKYFEMTVVSDQHAF